MKTSLVPIVDCEEVQIVSSTSMKELLAQTLYRAEGKAGPGHKTKEAESSAGTSDRDGM